MKRNTKKLLAIFIGCISLLYFNSISAQEQASKPSIALLELDVEGMHQETSLITDLCRTNLYQLNKFIVMDKYDVDYILKEKDVSIEGCYGSMCLSKVGSILKVDKMLTGNIQRFPKKFTIRLRLIDIQNQIVEKDVVMNFLKLENQISSMFEVTLKKMFDMPVDLELETSLTKENNFENTINTPEKNFIRLNGPRAGFVWITGESGKILNAPTAEGGFDSRNVMFQFGYQFEKTYLNSGNIQALFEFIPMISGVDQGKFIPSMVFLNGIRNNINGFEFAFGPIFLLTSKAKGFYIDDQWYLKDEAENFPDEEIEIVSRFDSRGDPYLDAGLVFAFGKTLKSGSINYPINVFTTIKKKDVRIGISVGYNAIK